MADLWATITDFGVMKAVASVALVLFVGFLFVGRKSNGGGGSDGSSTPPTPPAQ